MSMTKVDHGHDLFRLVYASRAVLPVLARFDAAVGEILESARRNNEQTGVSGVLVAHRGWFIQALEGPRRNVSLIFSTIGRDPRHGQIEVLDAGAIAERRLGRWSMCAMSITSNTAPVLRAVGLAPDFDPFQMSGAMALELMAVLSRTAGASTVEMSKAS